MDARESFPPECYRAILQSITARSRIEMMTKLSLLSKAWKERAFASAEYLSVGPTQIDEQLKWTRQLSDHLTVPNLVYLAVKHDSELAAREVSRVVRLAPKLRELVINLSSTAVFPLLTLHRALALSTSLRSLSIFYLIKHQNSALPDSYPPLLTTLSIDALVNDSLVRLNTPTAIASLANLTSLTVRVSYGTLRPLPEQFRVAVHKLTKLQHLDLLRGFAGLNKLLKAPKAEEVLAWFPANLTSAPLCNVRVGLFSRNFFYTIYSDLSAKDKALVSAAGLTPTPEAISLVLHRADYNHNFESALQRKWPHIVSLQEEFDLLSQLEFPPAPEQNFFASAIQSTLFDKIFNEYLMRYVERWVKELARRDGARPDLEGSIVAELLADEMGHCCLRPPDSKASRWFLAQHRFPLDVNHRYKDKTPLFFSLMASPSLLQVLTDRAAATGQIVNWRTDNESQRYPSNGSYAWVAQADLEYFLEDPIRFILRCPRPPFGDFVEILCQNYRPNIDYYKLGVRLVEAAINEGVTPRCIVRLLSFLPPPRSLGLLSHVLLNPRYDPVLMRPLAKAAIPVGAKLVDPETGDTVAHRFPILKGSRTFIAEYTGDAMNTRNLQGLFPVHSWRDLTPEKFWTACAARATVGDVLAKDALDRTVFDTINPSRRKAFIEEAKQRLEIDTKPTFLAALRAGLSALEALEREQSH